MAEYYVRPVNGNNGNTGLSHAQAWQTFAHAITQLVTLRNATTGDRINVNSEGTDTVTSVQSVVTSVTAPLVVQGYTSTAGDGGIGILSGGNTSNIMTHATNDGLIVKDMKIMNCPGNAIDVDAHCRFDGCWFTNITGNAIDANDMVVVTNCRFDEISGRCVRADCGAVWGCHMLSTSSMTKQFTAGIIFDQVADGKYVVGNIIHANGASAMEITGTGTPSPSPLIYVAHNSLLMTNSVASTRGIRVVEEAAAGMHCYILDNLIEGFVTGIDISAATSRSMAVVGGNSLYNNTTAMSLGDAVVQYRNETLLTTPFAKVGTNDYSGRSTYFRSLNVGSVRSPVNSATVARGAVQTLASGSSTGRQGLHAIKEGAV